jgi:methyl-accepting chemotaxis protein
MRSNSAKNSRYSLQRTMIIYFLLVGFASLLVGVEFLAEFQNGKVKTEIWENITRQDPDRLDREAVLAPIDRLRSKALLMIAIVMLVMVIVLTMFIKNITEPLQHMIKLAQKISSGDLSPTIRIHANNELSELGNVINEMASNLQEIILLCRSICENGRQLIDQAQQKLTDDVMSPEDRNCLRRQVDRLGDELLMLDEIIAYFSFYSLDRKAHVE